MKRRAILAGITTVGVSGCLNRVRSSLNETTDPMNQTLNGDFKSIQFTESGQATLYFAESHACSGFAISHQAQQNAGADNIISCKAPEFEGPVKFDIKSLLNQSNLDYPDNKFKATGLKGTFSECHGRHGVSLYGNSTSVAKFFVPKVIWSNVSE